MDVAEGAVGEDGSVEGGVEVVSVGDDGAEVLAYKVRVVLDGLRERGEDDAKFGELRLKCGGDGHAVKDGVDRDACQHLLLLERDSQLFEGGQDLGVNFVEAAELFLLLGGGVVNDVLEIDGWVL